MGFGDFLSGLTGAYSNYLTSERQRVREAEDKELQSRISLLTQVANHPNFKSEHYGMVLNDINQLIGAQGKQRKQKKGSVVGETEMPVTGVLDGMRQWIEGQNPSMQAQAQGFSGDSVMNAPVTVPPKGLDGNVRNPRLASAGHQMQENAIAGITPPPQSQPAPINPFYTDDQMEDRKLQSSIRAAKETTKAREDSEYQATIDYYHKIGFSDEEIKQMLQEKAKGSLPRPFATQLKTMMINGEPVTVQYDPNTRSYLDNAGNPINVPTDARQVSIGPDMEYERVVRPDGTTLLIPVNKYNPEFAGDPLSLGQGFRQYPPQLFTNQLSPYQEIQNEDALHNRYMQERQQITTIENQINQIDSVIKTGGLKGINPGETLGPGQITLIYSFNKILDPDSVVREGEFDRTGKYQGFLDWVKGNIQAIKSGGVGLTQQNAEYYVTMARQIFEDRRMNFLEQYMDSYANRAASRGFNPANVFPIKDWQDYQQILQRRKEMQPTPQQNNGTPGGGPWGAPNPSAPKNPSAAMVVGKDAQGRSYTKGQQIKNAATGEVFYVTGWNAQTNKPIVSKAPR